MECFLTCPSILLTPQVNSDELPEGDESKKAIEGSHSYIENEKVKGKASGVGGE